ncbi:MAG TPA: c-type cytochrome domain-containing protein [Candidatus Angelobacter sp.]|nr:c-type cytochrome domain-containing protein [Candidatus Angelobacter sp.]
MNRGMTWMRRPLGALLCGWAIIAPLADDTKPVSYFHEVVPILKRSCTGCHHPAKLKGELDLTTYESFKKGGKHGASFAPGDPDKSRVIEEISGEEPDMPKEGDPLSKEEIALIERWVKEGAKDDTPPNANSFKLSSPPVYAALPVISAIAFSPEGDVLAVSAYHEVVLHKGDGSAMIGRLVGEAPRIESVVFSPDGTQLAVSGGAPARFGEIQIWDVAGQKELHSYKISNDSVFGVSFSPDGGRVAFGCADKTVRVISVADGKELMKFDNHSDWVLGTLWTVDGKRLLSGSRDRAMKLINVTNGQFIDDINKLLEGVMCMARHPKEDIVAYGGDLGTPRIYRIAENQGRTAANNDVNQLREFERQPGPVCSIAYNPDGSQIAVGNMNGEVRVYKTSDGTRVATLKENRGAVFALKFHPKTPQLFTGGYDGKVRIFELPDGKLSKAFDPVPINESEKVASVTK